MLPTPDPSHQLLAQQLFLSLGAHLGPEERLRLLFAPVDIVIDDESVLQPDVLLLKPFSPNDSFYVQRYCDATPFYLLRAKFLLVHL